MAEKKATKKSTPKRGVVYNCLALNLRETPSLDAPILEIMGAGSELEIDRQGSANEFYKVRSLRTGTEGFCLKAYVERT